MSRATALIFLYDVHTAIAELQEFTGGMDEAAFVASRGSQLIAERLFITIGEDLNGAQREAPDLVGQIPDIGKIIAMRNVLVHHYRRIDLHVLWAAIEHNVCPLDVVVETLLEADS